MSTSKHIDKICCAALAFVLLFTFLFIHAEELGVQAVNAVPGYESRLFNGSDISISAMGSMKNIMPSDNFGPHN